MPHMLYVQTNRCRADAHHNRGIAHFETHDYQQALADFETVIRLEPNNSVAFNDRSYAYYKTQQLDEAIADATEAIRLDRGFALAYSNRGWYYFEKGEYERAIADYTQAIVNEPEEPELDIWRLGRCGEVRGMITGRELLLLSLPRIELEGALGTARVDLDGGLIVVRDLLVAELSGLRLDTDPGLTVLTPELR